MTALEVAAEAYDRGDYAQAIESWQKAADASDGEAVLAMAHIFTIHFFIEHWRPRCFPFSATMFEGSKCIEHLREEHPAWIARLEKEGRLDEVLCPYDLVPIRILYFGVGYALIGLGVFLLVFALLNAGLLTLKL